MKEGFGGSVGSKDCLECQQCHKEEASAVTSGRLEQKTRPRDNFWLHLLTPLSPAALGQGICAGAASLQLIAQEGELVQRGSSGCLCNPEGGTPRSLLLKIGVSTFLKGWIKVSFALFLDEKLLYLA